VSQLPGTVLLMVTSASRQRAEAHIRRALPAGHNPWQALDHYRARGGRIGWHDWFRLWRTTVAESHSRAPGPASSQPAGGWTRRSRMGKSATLSVSRMAP
jgi:hypothetical protein